MLEFEIQNYFDIGRFRNTMKDSTEAINFDMLEKLVYEELEKIEAKLSEEQIKSDDFEDLLSKTRSCKNLEELKSDVLKAYQHGIDKNKNEISTQISSSEVCLSF